MTACNQWEKYAIDRSDRVSFGTGKVIAVIWHWSSNHAQRRQKLCQDGEITCRLHRVSCDVTLMYWYSHSPTLEMREMAPDRKRFDCGMVEVEVASNAGSEIMPKKHIG